MGAGEEEGSAETEVGDGVAMGLGNAFDEAVHPESAQVVSHHALGDVAGIEPEQWCDLLA